MARSDEKRAKIIAEQAAREAADQAAGKGPRPTERRSNWAASPPSARRNSFRKPKPKTDS